MVIKFYFLVDAIWNFRHGHFCEQNLWKIVRQGQHQLIYLHIPINCS